MLADLSVFVDRLSCGQQPQVNGVAMEDIVIKEIFRTVKDVAPPAGTAAVRECCLDQKHSVLSHVCAALGGFILGFLTSKLLDWMSPDPGRGKTSIHHIHDHHHYHQQRSPRPDLLYGKVIG
ncbi:hypothetical protein BsWGS_03573 [Bradybaena similaris]